MSPRRGRLGLVWNTIRKEALMPGVYRYHLNNKTPSKSNDPSTPVARRASVVVQSMLCVETRKKTNLVCRQTVVGMRPKTHVHPV